MERLIKHMNQDHSEAVLDYARYYGRAPFHAQEAVLTNRTTQNSLDIEYTVEGAKKGACVTFTPPVEALSHLTTRLVAMANEASIARIPPVQLPTVAVGLPLVVLMFIFGCVTHVDPAVLASWPFPAVWESARQATEIMFRSYAKVAFLLAAGIHAAEAVYCLFLTRSLMKPGGRGWSRVLGWSTLTLLVGFPTLTLLLDKLLLLERTAAEQRDD